MAVKTRRKDLFDAQKFTRSLGALVDALPSEADRQQVLSQLETLIQFLVDLKDRIAAIPTREDASSTSAALDNLALLFAQVKSNPILGAAVGVSTATQRPRPAAITSEEIERAKLAIVHFESLPIDRLRVSLNELSARD